MNPLDYSGPRFLQFYFISLILGLIVALAVREIIRRSGGGFIAREENRGAYDLALLAGGRRRAICAALLSLVQSKSVKVVSTGMVRRIAASFTADEFEREVLSEIAEKGVTSVSQITRRCTDTLDTMEDRLASRNLLLSPGTQRFGAMLPMAIMLLVAAIGAAKIAVGLSRGRPVGFLVLSCALTMFFALVFGANRPRRTPEGDALLRQWRTQHPRAKVAADHYADNYALYFALFGPTVLAGTAYSELSHDFRESTFSGASDGGFISSCASGGGCGGGGGGGGCGGCGG